MLYIFSGLPGSGKSALSQRVAKSLGAAYLRIDSIEQGLRELCSIDVQGEGYRLALPGLELPSWSEVANREYHAWTVDRIVIDTAGKPQIECESELVSVLSRVRA